MDRRLRFVARHLARAWVALPFPALVIAACGGEARDAAAPLPAISSSPGRAPDLVLPAALPGAPTAPGPWPRARSFDAVAVNARCEECHAEIAAEWRGSLHRDAHTDPEYQSQLAQEPFPFCRACHAPEADPAGEGQEAERQLGVGCVTCHVVGDRILAIAEGGPTPHDGEHHPLTRTEAFEGPSACVGCHELAFPDQATGKDALWMQTTVREHAASGYSEQRCAECHMPVVAEGGAKPHRSHAFAASRDEAMVRRAVVIEQGPFVDHTLILTLRPGAVGHAFPTGDMMRRLALTMDVLGADGRPVEHEERYFARQFGFIREPTRGIHRVLVKDDRVGAGPDPVVVRYQVRRPEAGTTLRYSLRYERVSDPHGGEDGRALVGGSVLLAEGTLPLGRAP